MKDDVYVSSSSLGGATGSEVDVYDWRLVIISKIKYIIAHCNLGLQYALLRRSHWTISTTPMIAV